MSGWRLPAGGAVDRARPLAFEFDGQAVAGFEGDTVASALLAAGVRVVARSFKLHRPRGIVGLGWDDPCSLLQVLAPSPAPNVLATTLPLQPGMRLRSVNAWPNARFDLGGVADALHALLPAGFYYKTFMAPQGAWMFYEHWIRRAAGLGRLPETAATVPVQRRFAHAEVLVVGAGPAGTAAALALARSGQRVIWADDGAAPGGALAGGPSAPADDGAAPVGATPDGPPSRGAAHPAPHDTTTGRPEGPHDDAQTRAWIAAATAEIDACPNVRRLGRTLVLGRLDHGFFYALERHADGLERLWKLRAPQLVLASGALERPMVFPDNDRPGVMLASAVRGYLHRHGVAAARRLVVHGGGDDALTCALDAQAAGIEVAAWVDTRERVPEAQRERARAAGIAVVEGAGIVGVQGRHGVRGVDIAPRRGGHAQRIAADGVAMAGGWSPALHLLAQLDGRLRWSAPHQAFLPGELPPGVQVAGSAAGLTDTAACLRSGQAAARAVLEALASQASRPSPGTPPEARGIQPLSPCGRGVGERGEHQDPGAHAATQESHPTCLVSEPSPVAGEGLGRGGHAETPALLPLSPSPSPARGEGSPARASRDLVPGHQSVAPTAPHGSLAQPLPREGGGEQDPGPEPVYALPTRAQHRAFVDWGHDVTAGDIALAHREGYVAVEHLKRYTTLGMAVDQGKTSNVNGLRLMASLRGLTPGEVGTTRFRPPYVPLPFGTMAAEDAGDLVRPVRETPITAWHLAHGAVMYESGANWRRPGYHPRPGETLAQAAQREARAVREAAGLYDSTPLGKFEVRGPQAAELLEAVCANRVADLAAGRGRYALLLREDARVFDDGVVFRLGPEHFWLTSTAGNAAAVHGWLEQARQWHLRADGAVVTDVAAQWATLVICGPRAREVLQRAGCALDLDAAAFPFMAVREGAVAGVAARVFRVSFTGELSYEVNVPASRGLAVWQALWDAGQALGLQAVGSEANHILRVEKGYLSMAHEVDGIATPDDLGLAWAVKMDKPFFFGQAALRRLRAAGPGTPPRPELVGLRPLDGGGPFEEGAQLLAPQAGAPGSLLRGRHGPVSAQPGERPEGFVTASVHSPACGHAVALALLEGGRARMGEPVRVTAQAPGGLRLRAAEVCAPVFFDPRGERLRG